MVTDGQHKKVQETSEKQIETQTDNAGKDANVTAGKSDIQLTDSSDFNLCILFCQNFLLLPIFTPCSD